MYSTCLFCHSPLGENEVVERFPVGRRLAFDAAKGRLWVVCRKCARWNLTPLEERWEAIEECERRFGEERARAYTDQMGLVRLGEGLELVRIGRPTRTELAAWRYGDQFGERRRRLIARGLSGVVLVGASAIGVPALIGTGFGVFLGVQLGLERAVWSYVFPDRPVHLPHPGGGSVEIGRVGADRATLVERPDGGWGLRVEYDRYRPHATAAASAGPNATGGVVTYDGDRATHALGAIMARINVTGASAGRVRDAVQQIEGLGGPERYVPEMAARARTWAEHQGIERGTGLGMLPPYARLALEMAAHEESEQRAMEGELAALEAAWRDAEQIAAIADEMLLPASVGDRLAALKQRLG